jgi:hypothetical protein
MFGLNLRPCLIRFGGAAIIAGMQAHTVNFIEKSHKARPLLQDERLKRVQETAHKMGITKHINFHTSHLWNDNSGLGTSFSPYRVTFSPEMRISPFIEAHELAHIKLDHNKKEQFTTYAIDCSLLVVPSKIILSMRAPSILAIFLAATTIVKYELSQRRECQADALACNYLEPEDIRDFIDDLKVKQIENTFNDIRLHPCAHSVAHDRIARLEKIYQSKLSKTEQLPK